MNAGPYGNGSFRLLDRCGYRIDPETGRFCENRTAEVTGIERKILTALFCGRVIRTVCGGDICTLTLRSPDGTEVTYDRLAALSAETGDLLHAGDAVGTEGTRPVRISVSRGGYPIHAAEYLGIPNIPGVYRPPECSRTEKGVLCPGDPVRIGNPVRYGTGHRFQPYYDMYEVVGIRGDRVTIGIGGFAVAVLHRCDVIPL